MKKIDQYLALYLTKMMINPVDLNTVQLKGDREVWKKNFKEF